MVGYGDFFCFVLDWFNLGKGMYLDKMCGNDCGGECGDGVRLGVLCLLVVVEDGVMLDEVGVLNDVFFFVVCVCVCCLVLEVLCCI